MGRVTRPRPFRGKLFVRSLGIHKANYVPNVNSNRFEDILFKLFISDNNINAGHIELCNRIV